ncbi:hypothetical protein HCG69_06625 [Bacteroides sp. K03]|uniref:type IV toxin-antitoxin system AbiEi family antitoxin domain-containing protein n=1 Tax=Bacteroides TaxID=816 RepID=UPI001C8B120F|nr:MULTISPECIES: hypothetical protein [Bacteroides]MBX9187757.1 hypothetical protein [Bacteroides sp. K03]
MNSEESKNRFISSSEVKEKSRSAYYKLLKSAREGNMVCIRRGVYATMEQLADTMIDLDVVVPAGILCLFSAWNIHGLTTSLPQAYHVAIKRGRKIQLPEYPPIELHSITEPLLELGVEDRIVSGYHVKVYNVERSVCDAIKYRNKIGMDVCSEVVNSYLALSNRNLTLLMDYASKLRVTKTLEKYLEIKL